SSCGSSFGRRGSSRSSTVGRPAPSAFAMAAAQPARTRCPLLPALSLPDLLGPLRASGSGLAPGGSHAARIPSPVPRETAHFDVIVIGGGHAGVEAAWAA